MRTALGQELPDQIVENYFDTLVNQFYKILPIWESGEPTLPIYIHSLQREMIGCRSLMDELRGDGRYMTLLAILQRLADGGLTVQEVRSDVFRAISICKQLREKYAKEGGVP